MGVITFKDPAQEKNLRATLKSEVSKFMSKEEVVIFDSMNYIKGKYKFKVDF